MPYEPGGADRREELVAVIHRVRNRWRLKLALRGAVIVVAGTLLALMASASSLEALRFSPLTPSGFNLPLRICGTHESTLPNRKRSPMPHLIFFSSRWN